MENRIIERYTYAVTRNLPEKQRADIEKELKGLVEDMLDDRLEGRQPSEKDVEAVLLELGDPKMLAERYRGRPRYLIGPELFPTYLTILKIVFSALAIAMMVVFSIQAFLDPAQILDHFLESLLSFITGSLQAFAWVTGIFGLIEYRGEVKENMLRSDGQPWGLADLPALPEEESRIPRSEPTASIIFLVLFLALLAFALPLFGVWVIQDGASRLVIPFLNETVVRSFFPFILAGTALNILVEALKLITGKWTLRLIAFDTLSDIANLALGVWMVSTPGFWNAGFIGQMVENGVIPAGGEVYRTVSTVWYQVTQNFAYFLLLIFVILLISTVVKVFRLRNFSWNVRVPAA